MIINLHSRRKTSSNAIYILKLAQIGTYTENQYRKVLLCLNKPDKCEYYIIPRRADTFRQYRQELHGINWGLRIFFAYR